MLSLTSSGSDLWPTPRNFPLTDTRARTHGTGLAEVRRL
jgi:hypothetical protein